ncbi:glycosyltransferase [Bradyrhizobium sp. INPA01-394B]|uniref:glycosyltransferase n=1 Tax=Bradyrhizobium campsiandrae TaxID=1729892 RepID=UPI00165F8945|nr:glycosyltransferase [Bradyrhizobium campsiandrae]MBC9876988.1 glycosyltransferase [Bradyrhizobium campsiandrae]
MHQILIHHRLHPYDRPSQYDHNPLSPGGHSRFRSEQEACTLLWRKLPAKLPFQFGRVAIMSSERNELMPSESKLSNAPLEPKPSIVLNRTTSAGRSVACVIVTYGRREQLVRRTVAAVQSNQAVKRVIVVDNGCRRPVRADDFATEPRVDVIRLDSNLGSAGGFHAGITAVQRLEDDDVGFVLILDDDNVGEDGFLERLLALHTALGATDDIGLCALRRHRGIYPTLLADQNAVAIRANSFLNFHLASLPSKLWRRFTRSGRPDQDNHGELHLRRIETAPYGGLLLPMAAIRKVSPPNKDFVLYSDDHDYSLRLMDAGITVYLTDVGCINDAEESWDKPSTSARSALVSPAAPAWRLYYACRNRILIEKRYTTSPIIYRINRTSYVGLLAIEAILA